MELFLTLLSGISWCVVYEECIRLSIRDKTYAMPFWALALNITWEGIYAFSDLHGGVGLQAIVNLLWFALDIVILFLYLRYGKREWSGNQKAFYLWAFLGIAAMLAVQLAFVAEFGLADHRSAQYSAFVQNLIMSVAFIGMLRKRESAKGQSRLLAVAKWIGTLAPTIAMGMMATNYVVLACGLLCTVYDILYIVLLQKMIQKKR